MSATNKTETTRTIRCSEQGFDVFVLQNEALELALVPALGAKIISLRDLATGHEWMWHPPAGMKLFRNRLGDDFATSTMTGWDECIPTIAPCLWKNRKLPDHGETWSVPWAIDLEAFDRGVLKTSVAFAVSPFHFERTIELRGNEIHLNYQLENLSNEPEEFLWAMHPLLPVDDGIELQLSVEVRNKLAGEEWINGLKFRAEKPACVKVYAGPLREGQAGVVNTHSRDRLLFAWDTKTNNTLGVWLTRGGWNGYHHVALEPANGAPDTLIEAAKARRCGIIQPKEQQSWQIKLRIGF
jgi:galactose mutarotase-like enzyme